MDHSNLFMTLEDERILIALEVPVQELESAFGRPLVGLGTDILPHFSEELAAYFSRHLSVRSLDGSRVFSIALTKMWVDSTYDTALGESYLELLLRWQVPVTKGLDPYNFLLAYDGIAHAVATHQTFIRLKGNFSTGSPDGNSEQFAVIARDGTDAPVDPLEVRLGRTGRWRGVLAMFSVGMHHIARGADHILFLITLLLIAPLRLNGDRWSLFQGWGYTLRRFLRISLAFTIGHSLALVVATLGWLLFNVRWIEILIAASILMAAVNCAYPIFRLREVLVALIFGCIHGLAFSEAITGLNLPPAERVLAILGFNFGIEAMQLVIMLLCLPVLYLSKFRLYHYLRWGLGAVTGVAAIVWLVERVG